MKRCPTCQKTFDDNKRFCQIDGTPLVDDAPAEPVDPYKTVVGGSFPSPSASNDPADDSMKTMVVDSKSKDDDPLQIPEVFDPMKTVVASDIKKEIPSAPKEPVKEPEPPKFNEPNLSPPSFGDLSSYSQDKETPKASEPPKFDSPYSSNSEPPKQTPPVSENEPKFGSPFSTPNEQPKFDSSFDKKEEEKPKNDPFPPFKDPTTPLGEKKDPFQNSAFGLPQTPLEESYTPPAPAFNPPPAASQNDWSAPPPPVAGWENQQIGQNTPFNPPVAGAEGENKTLAIVSLVLGIISVPCCGFIVFGIAAAVTGFLAKKKADENPKEYGGRGLALAGMIIGGVTAVLGLVLIVVQILFGALGSIGRF